jgi:sugar lactone lactonase YvrE
VLLLAMLFALVACVLRPPHVVLNVTDPYGYAADAVSLVTQANGASPREVGLDADALGDGQLLTLFARAPGARRLTVEARGAGGEVLGRTVVDVTYQSDEQPQVLVELQQPCDGGAGDEANVAQCQNLPGCGVGRCTLDGVCACGACGDFIVDPDEQCDDGNNSNPNDGCHRCADVRWTPEVLIGLASGPLDIPFDSVEAIAVDQDGNLFFAATDLDTKQVVWRVDATTGFATPFAGGGDLSLADAPEGAVATTLDLVITDLKVDGLGDAYVSTGAAVLRIDRTGRASVVAGGASCPASWSQILIPAEGVPARAACFDAAHGVAVGGNGDLYIADSLGHAVYHVDAATSLLTVFAGTRVRGHPTSGQEGTVPTLFPLAAPRAVALDNVGRLFIVTDSVESSGNAVRVVHEGSASSLATDIGGGPIRGLDAVSPGNIVIANLRGLSGLGPDGVVLPLRSITDAWPYVDFNATAVATSATGALYFFHANRRELSVFDGERVVQIAGSEERLPCCDGVPGTSVRLGGPQDLARTPDGDLLIASYVEKRVRRVNGAGIIDTLIGTGIGDSLRLDEPLDQQPIPTPRSVTTDSAGRVYIAVAEGGVASPAILRLDEQHNLLEVVGGAVVSRPLLAAFEDAGAITDLVVDRNQVFYIDESNDVVRALDLQLGSTQTVAGVFGGDTLAPGTPRGTWLWDPSDIAVDPQGRLLVADLGGGALYRVDRDADTLCPMVVNLGVPGESCWGGSIPTVPDFAPESIAVDEDGTTWIATFGMIYALSPGGVLTHVYGDGASGHSGDGAAPERATFAGVTDLLVDDKGLTLLDGDFVRRIEDQVITTVAGPLHVGDGPVGKARLRNPTALVKAGDHEWLVADGDAGRIRRLDLFSARLETVVGHPFGWEEDDGAELAYFRELLSGATGVAIADEATLFLSEGGANVIHRVSMVPGDDPRQWTIAPFLGEGGLEGTTNGSFAETTLSAPAGLAYDEVSGVLFVADSGSHTVRAVDLAGGNQAERVATVLGTPGQRGNLADGVLARDAYLNTPVALATAYDEAGLLRLFVADRDNHRVLSVIDPLNELAQSYLVLGDGAPSSSGEGAVARLSSVQAPAGLALDRHGNLYVSSTNTVRQVVAGDDLLADGDDMVRTLYGRLPRTSFPEPVTQCLTDLDSEVLVGGKTRLMLLDACQGFVVSLTWTQQTTDGQPNTLP